MGCDIHLFAEVKIDGEWVISESPVFSGYPDNNSTEPFGNRAYSVFGFLADVRNRSNCKPISECKGLPDDSKYLNTPLDKPERYTYYGYDNGTAYTKKGQIECDIDYHSHSWLTLKELLDFDYSQTFEDLITTETTIFPDGGMLINGGAVAEKGKGKMITYREHLGESFFFDLVALSSLGSPNSVRVIFWFDN